jgi:hypothetical protein
MAAPMVNEGIVEENGESVNKEIVGCANHYQ